MTLDVRKRLVLQAVVESYVSTAEPVGSRTVARKYQLGVSPATIRNEMADLEEMGYLEQPHTSAGRVPSDKGYRFYVDRLMRNQQVAPDVAQKIREIYKRRTKELEALIQITAKLLSETTDYMALVLGPRRERSFLRFLRMIPVGGGRVLLALVTDTGFVENRWLHFQEEVDELELERISDTLNRYLQGVALDEMGYGLLRTIDVELSRSRYILTQIMELLEDETDPADEERVYLGGTVKILNQPEFKDIDKLKELLGLLENEEDVYELLNSIDVDDEVTVTIGNENRREEIRECSLVTGTYRIGNHIVGKIAVLGPRRMEYAKVVSVVDYVTRNLSEILTRYLDN